MAKDQIMPALVLIGRAVQSTLITSSLELIGSIVKMADPRYLRKTKQLSTSLQCANASPYVKDAFHRYLVDGEMDSVNPEMCGTKRSNSVAAS